MMWLARLVEQTNTVTVGTATLLLPLYPPAIVALMVPRCYRTLRPMATSYGSES